MVAISILLDSCGVSLKYARIEQVKERRLCWQSGRRHELESEFRRVCLESWGTVRQRGVQTRSQGALLLIHGGGENIGDEIERLTLFIWRYTTFTRKFTAEKAAA